MDSAGPLPPDISRAPGALALVWIEAIICVILITLRFIARRRIKAIGRDDWTMLGSVILFLIGTCLITYIAAIGGFRHSVYLSLDKSLKLAKFNWIEQPFWVANFGLSKIAVGLLILRLLAGSAPKLRLLVWFFIGLNVTITLLGIIFIFAQCRPTAALWEPELQATAKCWTSRQYNGWAVGQTALYLLTDVVFAVVPVSIVSRLRVPLKKKLSLCAVLSLGIFAAVIGAVKIPVLTELNPHADVTWELFPLICYTTSEVALIIWASCIVTLGPLFRKGFFTANGASVGPYGSGKALYKSDWSGSNTGGNNIHLRTDTTVEFHDAPQKR